MNGYFSKETLNQSAELTGKWEEEVTAVRRDGSRPELPPVHRLRPGNQAALHPRRHRADGFRPRHRRPGRVSLPPRQPGHRLPRPHLDLPDVLRHGKREGHERPLAHAPQGRTDGAQHRLRFSDAHGLRQRLPQGARRVRPLRRRHRHPRRFPDPDGGDPDGSGDHLHDDQSPRHRPLGDVLRGGGEQGGAADGRSAGRSRTTCSRSSSPRRPSCARRSRRCG